MNTPRIPPPSSTRPVAGVSLIVLLVILSMVGGIIMIVAHYIVAGIPEAIQLW